MSNEKTKVLVRHLANTMLLNSMFHEAEAEMEAQREYWKAQNEKREKEYRQSMEFKQKKAKKRAKRLLRKKSQGR